MDQVQKILGRIKSMLLEKMCIRDRPDEEWEKLGADGFWEKYNKPWLQKAIKRKDIIKVATPPSDSVKYWYDVDGVKHLTGFGKEIELLENAGYYYDVKTSSYIKP